MAKFGMVAIPVCLVLTASIGLGLAAQTAKRGQPERGGRNERAASPSRKSQPPQPELKPYIIEPPDVLIVEVLEALPARPITGERLVRPDGKISLGYYGDVYVAGLTISEAKEKVVLHLRKHLRDSVLGLWEKEYPDPDDYGKRDPKDSDRVFVDVFKSNSKFYYVQGAFAAPGRLPASGSETVLDMVNKAGGLMPTADHEKVFLYRKDPEGGPPKKLRISIDDVMLGDDVSTNYYLQPGDRLVALPKPEPSPNYEPAVSGASKDEGADERPFRLPTRELWRTLTPEQRLDVLGLQMMEMQSQLNRIVEKLDKP